MVRNKENAINDFIDMIKHSWTYEKLTKQEKYKLVEVFNNIRVSKCLKGTYKQRYDILQAIYMSFLYGVGYNDFNWRCDNE